MRMWTYLSAKRAEYKFNIIIIIIIIIMNNKFYYWKMKWIWKRKPC